jgi:serine/threonine-protein kinase
VISVGATLGNRFTLDQELGQGGMGTVYRATDKVLGRSVAIKLLRDSRTESEAKQIRLEAQILARLVHDRIVRLYDVGESDGSHFLVMEEVNGPSLASRWPILLLGDRLRICGQVAEALDYAHLQGVIHRDVKPGNVLLTAGDDAKLSDFGLSLLTGDRGDHSGTVRGTPLYMSPEQAQGKPLDHRADLYSVGVMLYECVAGEVPFTGPALAVLEQHIHDPPTAPRFKNPQVWSTLEHLILSLLQKSPRKRPASGSLVALALLEEAERARRLERINPGSRRAAARTPLAAPASSTLSVVGSIAELTPPNGNPRVGEESVPPSGMGALPSALSGEWETPGTGPVALEANGEPSRTSQKAAKGAYDHPVAREMLAKLLTAPMLISPEERFLCGHYLAYLLGGSRRGFLVRPLEILLGRPLDARNADRARFLLAMAWLYSVGPTNETIERASSLLDDRPEVRPALSPVVVMRYLASRETPEKRKWFRRVRERLQEASAYARKALLDADGRLNPGMMPGTLNDLEAFAPPRGALDAERVSHWNRVTEVWRQDDEFRRAVLRYATRADSPVTTGTDFWPEVVYSLVERTHWQRTSRPGHEALWDYIVGKLLHVPLSGVRLDRMMIVAIPLDIAEQLDRDVSTFVDEPLLDEDGSSPSESGETSDEQPIYVGATVPRDDSSENQAQPPRPRPIYVGGRIPREERAEDDDSPRFKELVPLSPTEPFLFTQGRLRALWEAAVGERESSPRPSVPHKAVPVGPYELAVVPIGRGRSTVRSVLQGMEQGKQIEIFTPSATEKDSGSRKVLAIWIYQEGSMAVVHVDFQCKEHYILWHAPDLHQFDFHYAEELRHRLRTLSMEVPDQLDDVLGKP